MYVPVQEDFPGHRKTVDLRALLKIDTADAYVIRIWCWALRNRPDGQLIRGDAEYAANWRGKVGKLEAALITAKWLDPDLKIHDWNHGAGLIVAGLAKKRKQGQERKVRHLAKRFNEAGNEPDDAQENAKTDANQRSGTRSTERSKPPSDSVPERVPERSSRAHARERADAPARDINLNHNLNLKPTGGDGSPPSDSGLDPAAGEHLVARFRAALYPGKAWPIDTPSAEREAALALERIHPPETLDRLFAFVAADKPGPNWRGWRAIAPTVAAFLKALPRIEAQAMGGLDEPLSPAADVVHRELDRRLQERDPGLALAPPTAAERLALNDLVAKHGRDRVRFCVRAAFEHRDFAKRVRDVDTLVGNFPALVSETAESWATLKNDTSMVLDPIPEEASQ